MGTGLQEAELSFNPAFLPWDFWEEALLPDQWFPNLLGRTTLSVKILKHAT